MLNTAYAAKYSSDLVIQSPDTDVFVLALGFCSKIDGHLYFHTVKGRNTHIIDINRLHAHLGEEKCDALVGLHVFSECDTVSAMHGVEKSKAYKKLISQRQYITLFRELGSSFSPSPELCKAMEAFTCDLCDQGCQDVNKVSCSSQESVLRETYLQTNIPCTSTSSVLTIRLQSIEGALSVSLTFPPL